MGLPPIMGIPLSAPKPADDKLELDLGEDDLDFPDDSLVLPVTDRDSVSMSDDEEAGTMLASEEEVSAEGDATIGMAAMDTDAGTIAMKALGEDGEMMSVDLGSDQTILAMEAPPWEGPTDEHNARSVDSFEEITVAPDEPEPPEAPTEGPIPAVNAPRKFAIPTAATTVDLNPPSAMVGSEHDQTEPRVGIPGESTRAYSMEELRKLGVKPPKGD